MSGSFRDGWIRAGRSGGGLGAHPRQGWSGAGGDAGQDPGLGLLGGREVVRLTVRGREALGLTGRIAGVQGVEGHRRGDLPGPQGDPAPGLAAAGGGPRLGGEVIGQDGDPVALPDGGGGAGSQEPERGDLDPAGDGVAGAAGGDVDGQPQLDAVGAVAGGERAGVIAEAAGDGDADRVHGVPPGGVTGRGRLPWWRPGDCGALPGGQVSAPGTGRARIPGSPGGEDVLPAAKTASAGEAGTKDSGKGAPAQPALKGAADQQKISARPDQRPGCGNDRATQADRPG